MLLGQAGKRIFATHQMFPEMFSDFNACFIQKKSRKQTWNTTSFTNPQASTFFEKAHAEDLSPVSSETNTTSKYSGLSKQKLEDHQPFSKLFQCSDFVLTAQLSELHMCKAQSVICSWPRPYEICCCHFHQSLQFAEMKCSTSKLCKPTTH